MIQYPGDSSGSGRLSSCLPSQKTATLYVLMLRHWPASRCTRPSMWDGWGATAATASSWPNGWQRPTTAPESALSGKRATVLRSSRSRWAPAMPGESRWVLAGLHPIEWIAIEAASRLMDRLIAEPPTDRSVVVFPLLNVDGFRRVEDDLRCGRRRWLRSNSRGVDLNRNWPTYFKKRRIQWRPGGLGNGGPSPLCEPETRAVTDLLDELQATSEIDVALSLHSFGRIILMPYGGRWRRPKAVGRARASSALGAAWPERAISNQAVLSLGTGIFRLRNRDRSSPRTLRRHSALGGMQRRWAAPGRCGQLDSSLSLVQPAAPGFGGR